MAPDDPRHGTENGYNNLVCRCVRCKEAHAKETIRLRALRREKGLSPDDPRHGKATTYSNWLCRCKPCTTAHSTERSRTISEARVA